MVFPILDTDALIVKENDVTTFYGRPTYYYRGVEIGHRRYIIKKFRELQNLILKETGKNITGHKSEHKQGYNHIKRET